MKANQPDGFVSIRPSLSVLDLFVVRTGIKRAIDANVHRFSGKLLDVGCGRMPYKNYITSKSGISSYEGVDIELGDTYAYHKDVRPDFFWDGITLPFGENAYDTVICTEVLEHVPDTEPFLREIHRVLKPGGVFFFTTPFLWPLHDIPFDEKRLTPFALKNYLDKAGFNSSEVGALGGWHASMALMLSIWVRRSGMRVMLRQVFSWLLRPVILFLYRRDNLPPQFGEGQMITGVYGIARK